MKHLLSIMFFALVLNAEACISDVECGIGNACVKPANSVSVTGICVTPTDQFGNKQYAPIPPSPGAHEIQGCQFDTDCAIGFTCVKQSGNIKGICLK